MATRLTLSFAGIGDAVRDAGVRQAVRQEADRIAGRARGINGAEGIDAEVSVSSSTNRNGRPVSRITSTAAEAEFGTSRTARRRVLGRAAEQRS